MMEVVSNIAGVTALSCSHIYSWHCLENKRINFKNFKIYLVMLAYVVLVTINLSFVDKFLRTIFTMIISMLANYLLIEKNIKKTTLMVLITQFVIMIAEMILVLIISILGVDMSFVPTSKFGGFAIDASVSIIIILIFLVFKIPTRAYHKILKMSDKLNSEYFLLFSFIAIIIANIIEMKAYYKMNFQYLLVFNNFVAIIYFVIIIHSFQNRNNYLKVYDKYNTTISSLKEYEDILNQYRVSNHENKNQLLTIRNMIKNKEKNIPEYIDKIVENKLKDNELLLGQTLVIPEGGLRGLIYSKMLVMKDRKIDFDLSVDKGIRTVQLIKLGDDTVLDICKIMGVFLDNAIEAVSNLDEKFIDLEMSTENNKLYISITNNYEGTILIEEIENHGYTTKGEGHGYGLSLVKELIDKNSLLKNEKVISSDEFTQRLVIDIARVK